MLGMLRAEVPWVILESVKQYEMAGIHLASDLGTTEAAVHN